MCASINNNGKTACTHCGSRRWIIAACDGRIVILKEEDKKLVLLQHGEHAVFTSVQAFWRVMDDAIQCAEVDEIVIVGTEGNVAWVQLLLPHAAHQYVVAEIRYPLMAHWLDPSCDLEMLIKVLELVLKE